MGRSAASYRSSLCSLKRNATPGKQNPVALHIAKERGRGFPRRPDGKKNKRRKPRAPGSFRMGKGRMRRAEAVRALKPKAKRTEWRLGQVRKEPLPGPHRGVAIPAPSWKGPEGAPKARKGRIPRCRWHASMGCPENPLTWEWLSMWPPTLSSSNGPRSIMHEINQQILNSKYKFKEGVPLKEYL
jgi:hypothetical protein